MYYRSESHVESHFDPRFAQTVSQLEQLHLDFMNIRVSQDASLVGLKWQKNNPGTCGQDNECVAPWSTIIK